MYVKYNYAIVLYNRYKRCIFQLWHYADEHSIVSRTPTLLFYHCTFIRRFQTEFMSRDYVMDHKYTKNVPMIFYNIYVRSRNLFFIRKLTFSWICITVVRTILILYVWYVRAYLEVDTYWDSHHKKTV